MADTLTTTTQVAPAVTTYYDRVLLRSAHPKTVHLRLAQHARFDKRNGNTYKWHRYANLSDATTPLFEGINPPGQRMSQSSLTAQLAWFGDFVHITDVVDMTVEDPVLTIAAEKLGKQEGKTFDTLMRDILSACASATNASAGSNGNTPTELTRTDVDTVVKTLLGNDADMIEEIITASTGVGTAPVRAAYWGIGSTALVDDMEDCAGFIPTSEYPSQSDVQVGEWGAIGNTRWLVSTNAKVTTDSPAQYHLPIIGQDAYGDVALLGSHDKSGNITSAVINKAFGSGGTEDPLNRKATSGWKAVWVARILNDNFMHVLEVTHS